MKLEWVNQGKEFEIPKKPVTVDDEIEILDYIDTAVKEKSKAVQTYTEFIETIYRVLLKIDSTVTRDMVRKNIDRNELAVLYNLFMSKGHITYNCPHCTKSFTLNDLINDKKKVDDTNFQQSDKDTTVTKETS